jgi:hypothetical protein
MNIEYWMANFELRCSLFDIRHSVRALPAGSEAVNLAFFFEILLWVVAAGEML